jgi:hypothetical protein
MRHYESHYISNKSYVLNSFEDTRITIKSHQRLAERITMIILDDIVTTGPQTDIRKEWNRISQPVRKRKYTNLILHF